MRWEYDGECSDIIIAILMMAMAFGLAAVMLLTIVCHN